ncbi:lupus La protein homolog [Amphiura filiformis]|uniref:lupus La protein homolog n=1 Tax=Amphiura filiformis TaxID=82378 RepID=UPI003B223F78
MAANGNEAAAGPSDLEKKIIRQIEYYFGDANLSRDRFLQGQVKEDDGWVPLETMIRFNRLKVLATDYEVITGALAKSQSGLMEVSEDKQKIRRSVEKPIPNDTTEVRLEVKKRTIYCKGFNPDDSLDTVQTFLDTYGKVEHIQMRRDKDRKFKGSVFAVFEKEEAVTKFLETKDLKIGENEVVKMLKDEYYRMKTDERKVRQEEEKKEKRLAREKIEQEAIEAQQADFGDYEEGCVMHFTGVSDQTSREDLKELFGQYGTISWVDFERGQTEGCVRFDEETKAASVIEKAKAANDDKLIVREKEMTVRVLEGDEEAEHWKKVYETKSKIRLRKKMGGHHGYGKGRKRDGKGRGREGGRPNKMAKYEGKKTVFNDSDDEGGEEVMAEGGEEKRDEPEKTAAAKEESTAVPSAGGDATAEATKMETEKPESTQPESSEPIKIAVKRPLEEETSEAEPAQKQVKTAD